MMSFGMGALAGWSRGQKTPRRAGIDPRAGFQERRTIAPAYALHPRVAGAARERLERAVELRPPARGPAPAARRAAPAPRLARARAAAPPASAWRPRRARGTRGRP